MRTTAAITVLALMIPPAAEAAVGDVIASWETPKPGGGFNGIAYDGEYVWVKNCLSDSGWVYRCTFYGRVVSQIGLPYSSPSYFSYGLTYDGEYLWTNYQYNKFPICDNYRQYTTTGSYMQEFVLHVWYGSQSRVVTWDGLYLWTDTPDHRYAEKVSTAGSVVARKPMPLEMASDAAYYRRQLWYYGGDGLVYGVTLNGSVAASFPAPGGSCDGAAFDGEYLWTLGGTSYPQYVYKVDIGVVGVAPASVGRVKALFR
jgi:hypothetical protein